MSRCIRDSLSKVNADRLIGLLQNLAENRKRFISVDGIVSRMREHGCSTGSVNKAHFRLQLLHWESRTDGTVQMPFVSKAKAGKIDPKDPDVFWLAVDGLVGSDSQAEMLGLPWPKALEIAIDLQNDKVWADFIETYHAIVETVEHDYHEVLDHVIRAEVLNCTARVFVNHLRFCCYIHSTCPAHQSGAMPLFSRQNQTAGIRG